MAHFSHETSQGNDVNPEGLRTAATWTTQRPRPWWRETPFVLPRKGSIPKFLRRMTMSSPERVADIASAPDRDVLRRYILPHSASRGGDILFVGVREYTLPYYKRLEVGGGVCWTIDFDPRAAQFGAPGHHVVGSILDLETYFDTLQFKTIIMAGVLGDGVNRQSEQAAAISACAAKLEGSGVLVLSWNDRWMHTGVLEDSLIHEFDFTAFPGFPSRTWINDCDQQFALLVRKTGRSVTEDR